jgi:hypothetical protein
MKRMTKVLGLAAVAVLLSWAWAEHADAQGDGGWQREATRYGWQLDYQAAKDVARRTGKPLMVVFRCIP